MSIDQPRFPTPEDVRRASQLYQALREKADIDDARSASSKAKPEDGSRSASGH